MISNREVVEAKARLGRAFVAWSENDMDSLDELIEASVALIVAKIEERFGPVPEPHTKTVASEIDIPSLQAEAKEILSDTSSGAPFTLGPGAYRERATKLPGCLTDSKGRFISIIGGKKAAIMVGALNAAHTKPAPPATAPEIERRIEAAIKDRYPDVSKEAPCRVASVEASREHDRKWLRRHFADLAPEAREPDLGDVVREAERVFGGRLNNVCMRSRNKEGPIQIEWNGPRTITGISARDCADAIAKIKAAKEDKP